MRDQTTIIEPALRNFCGAILLALCFATNAVWFGREHGFALNQIATIVAMTLTLGPFLGVMLRLAILDGRRPHAH